MHQQTRFGHMGAVLRVDLSSGECWVQELSDDQLRAYVGGTTLGARYLYDLVPPETPWDSPDNIVAIMAGPVSGAPLSGAGTFSVVFKGPMTGVAGTTQANGFLAAFLKFCGLDGVVMEGAAEDWCYLHIGEHGARLVDASHLLGATTWEAEERITEELGADPRRISVFAIGPAGEAGVRFAALVGDKGHVAGHNGLGAVLGAKHLKAIAVERGPRPVAVYDRDALARAGRAMFSAMQASPHGRLIYEFGTAGHVEMIYSAGMLPVRNYTTNILPTYDQLSGQYMRSHFKERVKPCWACRVNHVRWMTVTEGPYSGITGEEPEYEVVAALGSQIGINDPGAVVYLGNLCDRLGMDCNEMGWLIGWVMECYQNGILSASDLDGLDMAWGNVSAVEALMSKIATREGCGRWLADGVMRAASQVGGDAPNCAVYTLKGASPRSHDHRARWYELFDTCVSNTSTIEAAFGAPPDLPGMPQLLDPFSPDQIVACNSASAGWRQFEDSLVICRFCSNYSPVATLDAVRAITGWQDLDVAEASDVGKRATNLLRAFNLRAKLDVVAMEAPSPRYASTPVDGPARGKSMADHFYAMRRAYWQRMGWDPDSGVPLPATLTALGLEDVAADLAALAAAQDRR